MKYLASLFAVWCSVSTAVADITVFAAASLKEPLDQIAAEIGGVTVAYGGSGTLARQVSLGAPADVVILANADWMDVLEEGGHLTARADILSNRLVLVSAKPGQVALTPDAISAVLGDGRLAMGFTASVPAGIYGKAALESLGLWDGVKDQIAQVDNVRAALALVARGEAPLGVVYATDVRVVPDLHIAASFPETAHPPIRYVAGLTGRNVEASAFIDALRSPKGQARFIEAGFLPAPL